MSENTKPNNERPADLAVQDSVGGMARKVLSELKILGATGGGHPNACGARFASSSMEEETLPAIITGAFERAVSAGEVPIFEPAN